MIIKLDAAKELVARWTRERVANNPHMTSQDIEDYAICIAAMIRLRSAKQVSELYSFAVSLKAIDAAQNKESNNA